MEALEVSKYFLSKTTNEDYENGEGISNLKLQKLLYYSQKAYYSIYGEALFDDKIQAWTHGPVVYDVYHNFKKYGNKKIDIIEEKDFIENKKEVDKNLLVLDFIWEKYGEYEAWALSNKTHEEKAYKVHYFEGCNSDIPLEDLKDEKLREEFDKFRDEITKILESISL